MGEDSLDFEPRCTLQKKPSYQKSKFFPGKAFSDLENGHERGAKFELLRA